MLDQLPATLTRVASFPGGSVVKESACQFRRPWRHRFDPWMGSSPRGGNGNPLQYSFLKNLTDRAAWWATVHGVRKSQT